MITRIAKILPNFRFRHLFRNLKSEKMDGENDNDPPNVLVSILALLIGEFWVLMVR